MVKFHFSLLKLTKQPCFAKDLIGKCQILKSSGVQRPPTSLPTPMAGALY